MFEQFLSSSTLSLLTTIIVAFLIYTWWRQHSKKKKLNFHLKPDLSKKSHLNIVITGGTKGLGFALVKELLLHYPHTRIIYCGTTEQSIEKSLEQFEKEIPIFSKAKPIILSNRLFPCVCDVTNYDQLHTKFIPFIKEQFGTKKSSTELFGSSSNSGDKRTSGVDIWINNAGVGDCRKKLHEMSQNEIDRILNVNVNGTVYATQAAIQLLNSQSSSSTSDNNSFSSGDGGHVYLMEGMGSDGRSSPDMSIYGMSKASYRQFVSSLALENANSRVGIHRISPGMVITSMLVPEENTSDKVKRIFNILAEDRDVVAKYLIAKMVKTSGSDTFHAYLTPLGVLWRFMTFFMRRNKFFDKNGQLKEKYANQW